MPDDARVAGAPATGRLRVAAYAASASAYVLTRAFLIVSLLGVGPYGGSQGVTGDVRKYEGWAQVITATGGLPVDDPAWQYPPLAGVVFWIGDHITKDPVVGFICLAVAADLAVFLMLLLARRGPRPNAASWAYVALGLLIGPILLARFDVITAVFAVAALVVMARPLLAGASMGVGAALKLWPILLLLAVPRRGFARALVGAAGAVALITVAMFAAFDHAGAFLAGQTHRGLQVESLAGAGFVIARLLGAPVAVQLRFGSEEIISPGTGLAATVMMAVGAIILVAIAYLRLRGRLESVVPADLALMVTLVTIATSRVFSPQFMVWAGAIAATCLLADATAMRPVVVLCGVVALLGQITYQFAYQSLVGGGWVGSALQLVRVILLLVTTVWSVVLVWRQARADRGQPAPA